VNTRAARPAHELKEADFLANRVWRFITPGEFEDSNADESYVVAEADAPGTGQCGSFLVAAHYELQSGTVLPGVVQVDVLNTQIEFTPSTVFAAGKNVDPLGRDTETQLQRLLKTTGVQPIRWRLGVLLRGETATHTESIGKPGLSQAIGLLAQLARLKRSR
jgi:hypothetical protein